MRYLSKLWRIIFPVRCTLHDTIERGVYPYRCSRCQGCFVCQHRLIDRSFWICRDGGQVSTRLSPGVPEIRVSQVSHVTG